METARELQLQTGEERREPKSNGEDPVVDVDNHDLQHPRTRSYKWLIRVAAYIVFLLSGQSAATLLGRLYYDKGVFSNSNRPTSTRSPTKPKLSSLALLYLAFGLLLTGDNLMYSYGLLYLPVSTYSILCATQLAFNALFSFFLNSQKFTPFILNSLVLLTVSASLLAVHSDSDTTKTSRAKYVIGFLCTPGASATYSLYLSLAQLSFEKVIKRETFSAVLDMQIYPSFVATCSCVVGLFLSGEWRKLGGEMKAYEEGRVSYLMSLIWTALTWQISSVGLLGLIFEVSSLFSNVISTLALPVVPILAVLFFHDKMDGIKVMAMILAIWGFISYIYQHYLDDAESRKDEANVTEVSGGTAEMC
ncbi:probable purine permease 11 isoform X4 [Rhodamnia argentea]|uniref:Probable purine permease n=1 Tax=Rhodamnia argentea TaxID=178133 RepID=A0ABM3H7R1_9MYRT|nr:probable purine permease 11 isoform X4 [Rhodamnia argentea]